MRPPVAAVFNPERRVEPPRAEVIDGGFVARPKLSNVSLGGQLIEKAAARTAGRSADVAVVLPGQKVAAMQGDNSQKRELAFGVAELRELSAQCLGAGHSERISDMKSRSSGLDLPPSPYTMNPALAFSEICDRL